MNSVNIQDKCMLTDTVCYLTKQILLQQHYVYGWQEDGLLESVFTPKETKRY